jgi:hypothetical protein
LRARASDAEATQQREQVGLERELLRRIDWENPAEPDAKITKMKDGRTHPAHKAEHAIDLGTGALVVTLQGADVETPPV